MIVNNEAAVLARCLASLAFADAIVVVDDHSTDDTAAIAAAAGAKVYQRRLDRFDAQRNFGADQTDCEWILSIDADEAVTPALATEIRAVMADPAARDLYGIPFRQQICGRWPRYGGWGDPLYRLYRRHVRWEGAVHERLAGGPQQRGVLRNPILHWSHPDLAGFLTKLNRYTDAEAAARAAEGRGYSGPKLVLSPLRDFWRRYVVQQGWRDGALGLILAGLMAFYLFVARAKTWERLHPADQPWPPEVERP
jgi:glycosyltransferase involved in cell wall biosynthesis